MFFLYIIKNTKKKEKERKGKKEKKRKKNTGNLLSVTLHRKKKQDLQTTRINLQLEPNNLGDVNWMCISVFFPTFFIIFI